MLSASKEGERFDPAIETSHDNLRAIDELEGRFGRREKKSARAAEAELPVATASL